MKIVSWLNDLKLSTKMLIVAVFALVGLVVPTYFYVSLSLDLEYRAEQELAGIQPITLSIKLMKVVAEHRGMSARLFGGEDGVITLRGAKGEEVEQQFVELSRFINENIQSPRAIKKFAHIQDTWREVKSGVSRQSISEGLSFEMHSNIIIDLEAFVAQIMEYYLLSYDPEATSYHLIVANFTDLPRLADALGKIRGVGSNVLSEGVSTPVDHVSLKSLVGLLDIPYRDFVGHLKAAAAADDKFIVLEDSARVFDEKLSHIEEVVKQEMIDKTQVSYSPERFFTETSTLINEMYVFYDEGVADLEIVINERIKNINAKRTASLTVLFVLLLMGGVIGYFIVVSISGSIVSLERAFKRIAQGKYDFAFDTDRKDEMGKLNLKLSQLNVQLEKADHLAIEAARVKQALDNSSTCFMIADNDRKIIYLNTSVKTMLRECEMDLREVLPHFSANSVMGEKIDIFHKKPEHQKSILENLTVQHTAHIKVGRRYFRLLANPVYADNGDRLGTVVEWLDRTKEVIAETDIGLMVDAALVGDFSRRVETDKKEGFLLSISEGLNQLLDITERGLLEVSAVLTAIAEGNLTKRVEKDYQGTFDDIKTSCNTTGNNLADVIGEILEASETIQNASSEIARGNSDLSTRTEQQASSLEETASSMQQLTGTVRLNAENAKQANDLASQASHVAKNGGLLIEQVVSTMFSINNSSEKISEIIGVIDGIAFQTNILALNAAVEAARAGEQGRGFAVVASEVRTLAQRSANAAKDIKSLISDSVSKIEDGSELVNKSGDTMAEIVTSVQQVNDIMAEIAAASAQQASGIDEVGKAIIQMDEMTQQNAALVEEAAAAAERMSHQAEQLATRVGSFTLEEHAPGPRISQKKSSIGHKKAPQRVEKVLPPSLPQSDEDEWESF